MISLEVLLYTYVCGVMLAVSALGLESAIVATSLERWDRRFFTAFFAVLVACSATFFLELFGYVYPSLVLLQVVAYVVESLLAAIPFLLLVVYLLRCCGEDWRTSAFFRVMLGLWCVYLGLLVAAQVTDLFYVIALDGRQLVFGPAYRLLIAPLLVMLLLLAVAVIRRRGKLSRQHYRAFLACLVPVTLAVFVHMFISVFLLIDLGLVVSAFAMYRIIESDAVERDLRQQRELANQRASIAVLQMRPHFIYNTMMSIYYLCDQDPQLAKQVTMDFNTYLRKNLNAIAREGLISFSEELEHTRAYLAVEQAQFEDGLVVDYDTPHTQFRVPPLTLQPIVENAVKHGMDLDSGPLHILVRTREVDSGSELVVEDDGPGFDVAIADDPTTTLANIRKRIELCGGTLSITPRQGGGTVVRAMVPRRDEHIAF